MTVQSTDLHPRRDTAPQVFYELRVSVPHQTMELEVILWMGHRIRFLAATAAETLTTFEVLFCMIFGSFNGTAP
jgi:hypothetical protein